MVKGVEAILDSIEVGLEGAGFSDFSIESPPRIGDMPMHSAIAHVRIEGQRYSVTITHQGKDD